MVQKTFYSFGFAWNGLRTVWREERNFRIEVCIAIIVLLVIYFFNFSFDESVFCIIAIGLVLSGEILNTVVEDLCNKIEPNQDSGIGKIKDMVAGLVLVGVISAFVVGIIVIRHHFFFS